MSLKIGDKVCFQVPDSIHAKVGFIKSIDGSTVFVDVPQDQKIYKVPESKLFPA